VRKVLSPIIELVDKGGVSKEKSDEIFQQILRNSNTIGGLYGRWTEYHRGMVDEQQKKRKKEIPNEKIE
jgi:hypothetical protein